MACVFRESLIDLLKDWGTGLELSLYHEALTHIFGGAAVVHQDVDVIWNGRAIAQQPLRLAGSDVAFHLTALESASKDFESQAQRLLDHTRLKAYLWAERLATTGDLHVAEEWPAPELGDPFPFSPPHLDASRSNLSASLFLSTSLAVEELIDRKREAEK